MPPPQNLVRGRGLLCRSIMKSQMASPTFTPTYAALVAVLNTKVRACTVVRPETPAAHSSRARGCNLNSTAVRFRSIETPGKSIQRVTMQQTSWNQFVNRDPVFST